MSSDGENGGGSLNIVQQKLLVMTRFFWNEPFQKWQILPPFKAVSDLNLTHF
jgi:hypothetical protein